MQPEPEVPLTIGPGGGGSHVGNVGVGYPQTPVLIVVVDVIVEETDVVEVVVVDVVTGGDE